MNGHGNDIGNIHIYGANVHNIENVVLDDGNNYDLNFHDDITSGHGTLTIDASALSSAYGASIVTIGGTTPIVDVTGGTGDDFVAVGPAQGTVDLSLGGDDVFQGYGFATVAMGGALTAADSITGAAAVSLDGDYSAGITLGAATLSGVATLSFAGSHSYDITTNDGNVDNGQTMTVDASALGASDSLTFDGSAETGGSFAILGGAGNDSLTGGAQADSFDLTAGGTDTVHGGAGDDTINAPASSVGGDSIDGGAGNDTLLVMGGGTGSVDGTNTSSIETLAFGANGSDPLAYSFTVTGDITSGGGTLNVDASSLNGASTLVLDLTGATTATNAFLGGAGDDTVIYSQPSFFAEQAYNGGAGYNTITITPNDGSLGAFAYNLGDAYFSNLDKLVLQDGSNQGVQITGNVSHTGTLIVDAGALGAGYSATIDASASTSSIEAIGGAGADVLTGSTLSDTFQFNDVSHSTSTGYDTITNIDFSSDVISLVGGAFNPNAIDAAITTGSLSTASFDTDLASDLSGNLAAHHAVLFTADAGTLSGHTFLVVDANGTAGYQSGGDYVIDVTGYSGTLTTGSFI